ncbi:hypothetical protein JCM1840_005315 [Sporobolomyces johnsonii]
MQTGKSIVRATKNVFGYSDVESATRDATSNSPNGPSPLQLETLAEWSFNELDCIQIVTMLDKRLNDKGKNWRHVFKTLLVIDHLIHFGSIAVVNYFKRNIYIIKTLKEFQYIDDNGLDQGLNIRQKAKDVSNLLLNDERLRRERGGGAKSNGDSRSRHREPVTNLSVDFGPQRARSKSEPPRTSTDDTRRHKELAKEKDRKELAEAMKLSRDEEEKRQKLLREQAGDALFGDFSGPKPSEAPLVTLNDNGVAVGPSMYEQQLYEQHLRRQQEMQAQQNAVNQQYALMQLQQAQAEAHAQAQAQMQAEYLAAAQQQAQAAYFEQLQAQAQANYLAQQQQQAAQYTANLSPPLSSMKTGVNNPFAAFAGSQPQSPAAAPSLPSSSSYPSNLYTVPAPSPSPSLAPPQAEYGRPRASTTNDERHAELARLMALGGGVDTFGNVGSLRVPMGSQFASATGR